MSEFRPNKKRSARFAAGTERTLARARGLRAAMSPPERKLWVRLRRRGLRGLRFRRQHPVGPYILDFYCDEARLAVELDGAQHASAREHDAARDAFLRGRGIEVLRLSVSSFERDIPGTLGRIADFALARVTQLSARPSSPSGGGAEALRGGGGSCSSCSTEPPHSSAPLHEEAE